MTFGKQLLLQLYTLQIFVNCHTHLSPPTEIDQTERQQANTDKKQQKMPRCPFYPTSLCT